MGSSGVEFALERVFIVILLLAFALGYVVFVAAIWLGGHAIAGLTGDAVAWWVGSAAILVAFIAVMGLLAFRSWRQNAMVTEGEAA